HFLTVFGQDVTQAYDIFVRVAVEHQRRHRHQRIEPASGLIDGLTDVLGWKRLFELGSRSGRVRITPLRERHGSRVEPRVDDFGYPSVCALLALDAERHLIDKGSVRI